RLPRYRCAYEISPAAVLCDPSRSPSIWCENRPRDVPHPAVHLSGILGGVHVIDAEQAAGCDLDDTRIAEIPASAIIAQDNLAAPCFAAIFADAGTDAPRPDAIAIDADHSAILHLD